GAVAGTRSGILSDAELLVDAARKQDSVGRCQRPDRSHGGRSAPATSIRGRAWYDTVGVVDLNEQKVQHVITGLKEPQGVGYVPSSDTLFVANGGDRAVLLFLRRAFPPPASI